MAAKKKLDIKSAIKKPGALKRDLGIPEDEKIPRDVLEKASRRKDKTGQRARFAETLLQIHKK